MQRKRPKQKKQKNMQLRLEVATPVKKPENKDFVVTDSGTFKFRNVEIAMDGLKNKHDLTTPKSSPSTTPLQLTSSTTSSSDSDSTPNSALALITTPQLIPYEQLDLKKKKKLGTGASASVMRVEHQSTPYALKVIPLYSDEVNPSLIVREIKALYATLNCPNIIHFHEAYCRDATIQLLLEYMDCGSLDDVYKMVGKIPEDVQSEITYQILLGLKYLQQQQIVHRDIKPSNILLSRQGFVKISDFGMSKQLSTSIQVFKTFQGTFMYMSPERLKGEPHSFDSDIWSMGLTIAECVMGKFPFDLEMSETSVFAILQHIHDTGLNMTASNVSPELFEFLSACTTMDNTKRPTASDLLKFKFINKYNTEGAKPVRLIKFLKEVYMPKRKQKINERKLKQASAQISSPARNATTSVLNRSVMLSPEQLLASFQS